MKLSRLALAVALAPGLAVADDLSRDQALKLSDTVITANRDVQQRGESSAAISVFTRKDIERLNPSSVGELLSRVPGVQVILNGGRGANTSLFIRGTSNAQSLVLIDGVRIGSASSGGAALQFLSVEQIERVEVLRGSRSAMYGADALGGVVQIFTRRGEGEGLHPYLRLAGGSEGTWERSLGLSGGDDRTRYNLTGSLEETDGIDRSDVSYTSDADHDAFRNRSFSLNLAHSLSDDLEIGLSALDQRGKSEYDNPYGRFDNSTYLSYPAENWSEFSQSSVSAYVDANLADSWSSRLELGHSEDKQEDFDKLYPGSDVFNTYRDSAAWLNTLQLGNGQQLRVGLDYQEDTLHSSTAYSEEERWNQAVFIQHGYQGEHFSTELGLRHDKNEQYGSENTWNAALTLPLNAANELVLSYAEGFRVPTFNDLYGPDDWGSNPNLDPERSRSYELQWRSQLAENTRLEASLYRTDVEDLITYVWDSSTFIGRNYNVDQARINGFEASLQQQLGAWTGNLSLSIIDPRDRDSGHTLARRAKRHLSLDLDRRLGDFNVGATWQAYSQRYDDVANSREIAGYGVLDLRGSWQASTELAFDLKLANVLDKDYSTALYQYAGDYRYYGYQETPRSLLLGLTWTPAL
ncbi:TonB-dependent receptor [Pseudomonas sp. GOM6]|uniref:TonB-dependent receptor domain-containing protein n=1 Tax=Pseudomonas sp. GOM6 TaxID=3036944 RepID=UPI002409F5EC|nr:TonB-dependent receptor [Pseudomonas sp. GOM6]MDG1582180.1 TonB-dependent receptor [Pseudomonas sp. GOM6]